MKIFFTFTNSVDPDEMQQHAAFHLGSSTVCKNTRLGVSRIQMVISRKTYRPSFKKIELKLCLITLETTKTKILIKFLED